MSQNANREAEQLQRLFDFITEREQARERAALVVYSRLMQRVMDRKHPRIFRDTQPIND